MLYRGLTLDPFQKSAIDALREGHSVLVCAPTGTGKTVVADWLVEDALQRGRRVVYTAPVKALTNQKFRDYCRMLGDDNVGLVTGDLVIRRDAPCLVMTTEVLRNMMLAGDGMEDLVGVILDEIHFIDDRERGTVWEELLITLPRGIPIVGLSATLSNVEAFSEWLAHVRDTTVEIVEAHKRAVPLHTRLFSSDTGLVSAHAFDKAARQNAAKTRHTRDRHGNRSRHGGRRPSRRPKRRTTHLHVFRELRKRDFLPYLYFVFSRKDTEFLARALAGSLDRSLLTRDEQIAAEERLTRAKAQLGDHLHDELRQSLLKGVAYHHAGVHVRLKALVEELYEDRLIKVLYCTSTFALGVNMPARSVVFDGLKMYDGRSLKTLTTRQFMQKAGRAGRRGLDEAGQVILRMDPEEYDEFKSAITRYQNGQSEPVRSSFNLSFHSVVQLLSRHDAKRIRRFLDLSFQSWMAQQRPRKQKPWDVFQRKRAFLRQIDYVDDDGKPNAGGRFLAHIHVSEIFVTELALRGVLEGLSIEELFGVMTGLSQSLPRHAHVLYRPTKQDRALSRAIQEVRYSPAVAKADALTSTESAWDPDVMVLGRMWAQGKSLLELMAILECQTDLSGDLVSAFRRAKDLVGQLREAYGDIPERAESLTALIRLVSRDEVEVVG